MILKPFEYIYHALSSTKNLLYEKKWLPTVQMNRPLISIGNLSFGGTGKTPFTLFLVNELSEYKKIVLISKSYKARLKTPQAVNLKLNNAAEIFGDEAVLLQSKLPQVKVWAGPHKYQTALASQVDKPDLIILDDGFSHRQLQRNFDLVLFDASQIDKTYYRESIKSLKRAHAVVFTKVQDAQTEVLSRFKNRILNQFLHLENSIFDSTTEVRLDLPAQSELLIFCGIAKPESLLYSLENKKFNIQEMLAYSDHQVYSTELQNKILQQFNHLKKSIPDLYLATTEKDATKITLNELQKKLNLVHYQIKMNQTDKEKLLEKIRKNIQL
jgi:tetraacyldisaccharide 4'-kinase